MNEDVNKLVAELESQEADRLPGTNKIFDENDFIEMKAMSSVEDVKAFAVSKGLDSSKFNSALIATGLEDVEASEDIGALFGFTDSDLIGVCLMIMFQEIHQTLTFIKMEMNLIYLPIFQQNHYINYKHD